MFVVKSLRNNAIAIVFGVVNALLNSAIALMFVTFMCDQLVCKIVWPLAAALVFFLLGFYFFQVILKFSILKKSIAVILFVLIEIYLTVAWIYPASYFFFYGTKQALQHDICCETPKDYGAQNFNTLKIPMSDGIKIEGWYVAPSQANKATIILIHGSDNDRRHAADQARFLIAAGYGIFMYDQRGNGQSEGILDYLNPTLGHDLVEVTEWLQKNYQTNKIGVVGLSLGAHAAISAASQKPYLFSALWLDGLQAQGLDDFPNDMDAINRLQATLLYSQIHFVDAVKDKNAEGWEPVTKVLPNLRHLPIYLVAGDAEKFESDANKNYSKFSHDHLQVWMVPDGGHLTAVSDFPNEYQEKLLNFFDHSLDSDPKLTHNEN